MAFSIKKNGLVPRYYQLKEEVKRQIAEGLLTDRIPSERELARKYGLAHMTVRRAITELVEENILHRELGKGTYVSRAGGPGRRTMNIAFLLSPIVEGGALNPYFSVILRGIQKACAERDNNLIYCADVEDVMPLEKTGAAGERQRKVDGIIAAAVSHLEEQRIAKASKFVPVVALDCSVPGVTSVLPDNVSGGEKATRHLLDLGHTRVGHIAGAQESAVGRDRLAGYRRALEAAGIKYVASLVCDAGFSFEAGYEHAQGLLSGRTPPTALFCANDAVALGAMKRIQEMGMRVPQDVSVVGFDNIDAGAHVNPALTTVAVPKEEVARLAVDTLFRAIDGDGEPSPSQRILVETQLIKRESCAAPQKKRARSRS